MTSAAGMLSDTGGALALVAAVAAMLVLPGLAWNAVVVPGRRLRVAFAVVPGLLLLCLAGLFVWLLQPHSRHLACSVVWAPEAASAAVLALRLWRGVRLPDLLGRQGRSGLAVWAAVAVGVVATGLNPLPMANEVGYGSLLPGRMVASPPDGTIPYMTAVYFDHGFGGRSRSDDYFGPAWSAASRGPLVPLAVVALFRAYGARPGDMPDLSPSSPILNSQGTMMARSLGWLANALVVLGAMHLSTALRVGQERNRFGAAWLALSPLVAIDTVFLWPKLLAAFFVLLATTSVLECSWGLAAACLALAWYSHPVAILFLPALGSLVLWRAGRAGGAVAAATRFASVFAALLAPWLLYKARLGAHDVFLDYLLADGSIPDRARSLASWLVLRWHNVVYTLLPGRLFAVGLLDSWYGMPVSEPTRWIAQYAKTLPGGMGYAMVVPGYAAFLLPARSPALRALRLSCLATFAVMVAVWGYSGDGLGRNCLEPLVPPVIVVASALWPWPGLARLSLGALWLEGRWLDVASFSTADGFRWDQVPTASWLCWLVGAAASLGILLWGWGFHRRRPEALAGELAA